MRKIKFERIARRYKKLKEKYPDKHIDYCKNQDNLKSAIKYASLSIDKNGKRHSHQYRLKKDTLKLFSIKINNSQDLIKDVKSFDELYKIVKKSKIFGIGPLTIYDTALRIGSFLSIYPEKIYLHQGTKEGAKNLLGKLPKRDFLFINELPSDFLAHGFTASDFEDILCIYKKEMYFF